MKQKRLVLWGTFISVVTILVLWAIIEAKYYFQEDLVIEHPLPSQYQECVLFGEWEFIRRNKVRIPTQRPTVYEVYWDYTIQCDRYPLQLTITHTRPDWLTVGNSITFNLKKE